MNWKWGTAFGIMVLITVLSLVYALVQTTIAKEARRDAIAQKELAEEQRTMAEQARVEAERQRVAAQHQEEMHLAAMKELEFTLKELDDLKKKRK